MTPEMVADAARALRPGIVYPYHYGDTGTSRIEASLSATPEIKIGAADGIGAKCRQPLLP